MHMTEPSLTPQKCRNDIRTTRQVTVIHGWFIEPTTRVSSNIAPSRNCRAEVHSNCHDSYQMHTWRRSSKPSPYSCLYSSHSPSSWSAGRSDSRSTLRRRWLSRGRTPHFGTGDWRRSLRLPVVSAGTCNRTCASKSMNQCFQPRFGKQYHVSHRFVFYPHHKLTVPNRSLCLIDSLAQTCRDDIQTYSLNDHTAKRAWLGQTVHQNHYMLSIATYQPLLHWAFVRQRM
jgi:hypothetical protein